MINHLTGAPPAAHSIPRHVRLYTYSVPRHTYDSVPYRTTLCTRYPTEPNTKQSPDQTGMRSASSCPCTP